MKWPQVKFPRSQKHRALMASYTDNDKLRTENWQLQLMIRQAQRVAWEEGWQAASVDGADATNPYEADDA